MATAAPQRDALSDLTPNINVPANPPPDNKSKKSTKKANMSKKRDHVEEPQEEFDDEGFVEACEDMEIDQNCDQVRRKIRRLIDNGGMKIGVFCSKIGVTNHSYNTFMKQSGPDKGCQSNCYGNAWAYFKYRDMHNIPLPRANNKKQKTADDDAAAADASSSKKTSSKKTASKTASKDKDAPGAADLADIHLPGEEEDAVEVYDTCDEIRKKINAHLRKPGVTQASFCRDLMAMYHAEPRKVQATQLTRFRGQSGPNTGNTSAVMYAAYVFFEKVRLKEGKPKSKHREGMEKVWKKDGGFDLKRELSRGVFMHVSETLDIDQFGVLHFNKIR